MKKTLAAGTNLPRAPRTQTNQSKKSKFMSAAKQDLKLRHALIWNAKSAATSSAKPKSYQDLGKPSVSFLKRVAREAAAPPSVPPKAPQTHSKKRSFEETSFASQNDSGSRSTTEASKRPKITLKFRLTNCTTLDIHSEIPKISCIIR
ncbi:hypothetical protein HDV05_004790 [Chytridiales sp. JEL 0842]|nr:hypothetical protein HDV05_004790 [Chytridiales sp. JEL 0842]